MKYDYEKLMLLIKKLKKKYLVFSIILFVFFVGLATGLIIAGTYETRSLIKWIGVPCLFIILCLIFHVFINRFIFYKHQETGIYDILYGYQTELEGKIISINENVHLPIYKSGYEIIIETKKKEISLYILDNFEKPSFKIGDIMRFISSKSFVISYEKKNEK